MPSYVSPGVYVIEKDWSDYTPSLNSTSVGVMGFASEGPVGKATLVTNQDQLVSKFGRPDDSEGGFGLIGAYHILERTNTVMFTRVATISANVADVAVKIGTAPYAMVTGLNASANYLFAVSVSGSAGGAKQSTPLIVNVPAASGDSSVSSAAQAVLQAVNKATVPSSQVSFEIGSTSTTGEFVGSFAGSGASLELWVASSTDAFPVIPPGTTLAELGAGYSISSNTALVSIGNGWDGIVSDGQASGLSRGVTFVPSATTAGAYVTRTLYPGAGYNYSSVVETYGLKQTGLQNVLVSTQGANTGFSLYRGGGTEESAEVNMTSNTSGTSLNPEKEINNTTDETNKTSEYIVGEFALDLSSRDDVNWTLPATWGEAPTSTDASAAVIDYAGDSKDGLMANLKYLKLVDATYDYVGGINGDLGDGSKSFADNDVKAAIIGNGADGDGIYSYLKDDIDISILAIPGCTEQNIVNNATTLGETSQEYLFVSNPPLGITSPQNAISWSNGNAEGRSSSLNSSYTCVYWPWVKLFNPFTRVDEYVSPDVFAIRQMAFTDANFDAWIAPAGLVRGRLTKPVDVEMVLTQGDRDALYGPGNVINPIQKFNTDGIVIWGQRTTQRAATSLDRINVRRLMIVIRKMLLASTRQFVFEPNDAATWKRVTQAVEPMLRDIKSRRGITQFKVICDSSTNTPIRIDRSELWCKVIIQPTKAAEVIVFELNLTSATLGTNLPTA